MFLPDGKALIMDTELYRQTIDKSIVIDLIDTNQGSSFSNDSASNPTNAIENGGDQEFIQFWVNTPSKYKMEAPYYLPITDEDTPKIIEKRAEIAVVAGTYKTVKGPARVYSPQTLLRVKAEKHAKLHVALPKTYNTLLYVLNGELFINEKKTSPKDMVWFENDGGSIHIESLEQSNFIILSGEPINENVSAYGPFVMNSKDEINQAVLDYQNGKMGVLQERFETSNHS